MADAKSVKRYLSKSLFDIIEPALILIMLSLFN